MKKLILFALVATLGLSACAPKEQESKVLARPVPERMDDFVFENNLIAGRFYGEAIEGNPTSPGIDIWVKLPGKLVANEWYAAATGEGGDPDYYHRNHDGKDCYKVSVSLGGGGSVPYIGGQLCFPPTNYRASEIVEQTPEKVVFTLSYPEWQVGEVAVALVKKITVEADTYFCKVEDVYTFSGAETIEVAAGLFRHPSQGTIQTEKTFAHGYAVWENASDQSVEPEDGMLGVAVVAPESDSVCVTEDETHGLCIKTVKSGETFTYYYGSCWSKGDVKTADDWFALVEKI